MSDYDVYLAAMCLLFYVAGVLSAVFVSSWLKSRRDADPGYGDGYQSPTGRPVPFVLEKDVDAAVLRDFRKELAKHKDARDATQAPWACDNCNSETSHRSGKGLCFDCDQLGEDLREARGFYEKAGML